MKVGAVFIEMKKAFCSFNKFLLLDWLSSKFSFCQFTIKLVFDYLSGRFSRIRMGDFKSQPFEEVNSVPQGSSLGPLFFAAFIDYLADLLTKFGIGFKFYADDLAIHTADASIEVINDRLNEALASIRDWSLKNLISINTSKIEAMFFQKNKWIDSRFQHSNRGGGTIKIVEMFKYLGLILDPQLNFKLHFKHVQSKLVHAIGSNRRISKFVVSKHCC